MSLLKTVRIAHNSQRFLSTVLTCSLKYECERRRFAQDLIDFDKKWSKLFSGKPYSPHNADGVTHEQFLGCAPSLFSPLLPKGLTELFEWQGVH